jgi:hypothetical protein
MSAWRIQRRTDSGEMSKSAATSLIVRSPRRATTQRLDAQRNGIPARVGDHIASRCGFCRSRSGSRERYRATTHALS